jgi:hypothetical protein
MLLSALSFRRWHAAESLNAITVVVKRARESVRDR